MSSDQNKQQEPPERQVWCAVCHAQMYYHPKSEPEVVVTVGYRDGDYSHQHDGGDTLYVHTRCWPTFQQRLADLAQPLLPEQQKIAEIRERVEDNFRELGNDEWRRQYAKDARYLLSLLSDTSTQRCVNCGHADGVDAAGTCLHGINDTGSKTWDCPCKCVFGPTDVERGEHRECGWLGYPDHRCGFDACEFPPTLHWPFAAKHENCAECQREYEPPPSRVAEAGEPPSGSTFLRPVPR